MRIIPVIDLKQGLVVRGVGGRRESYQPIVSQLVDSAAPAEVAKAFVEKLRLGTVYVADLDAIAGADPDWRSYDAIAASGMKLWVDAGVRDLACALALAEHPAVESVILGLESLTSPTVLQEAVQALSADRTIFSLDLKHGASLTSIAPWQKLSPLEIAQQAAALGVQQMIVLDLASVGSVTGPTTPALLASIHTSLPQLTLISGGGIRYPADLDQLAASGCRAALIASALHNTSFPSSAW